MVIFNLTFSNYLVDLGWGYRGLLRSTKYIKTEFITFVNTGLITVKNF